VSADAPAAVETYIETYSPGDAEAIHTLDALVRAAAPELSVAIKYNILLYAFAQDWQHWVVAIDAHPKPAIGLRFLWGVLLADPRGVLRGGSSVLKTWDLRRDAALDLDGIRAYVLEAASKYPEYKANQKEIEAAAKAAATAAGRRKPAD
jgi:hypothetical protein